MYDGRGSVALEATYNAAWAVLGSWLMPVTPLSKSYSPFGEMLEYKISGYGFNGEQYDAATGMIILRARQYEPGMMRFAQDDTVRGEAKEPLTQNLFAYCGNDPVNMADPTGHSATEYYDELIRKSSVQMYKIQQEMNDPNLSKESIYYQQLKKKYSDEKKKQDGYKKAINQVADEGKGKKKSSEKISDYVNLYDAFWNRIDNYFGENWWQDSTKRSQSYLMLYEEAVEKGALNLTEIDKEKTVYEINNKMLGFQAIANALRSGSWDNGTLSAIEDGLVSKGIDGSDMVTADQLATLFDRDIIGRDFGYWLETSGLGEASYYGALAVIAYMRSGGFNCCFVAGTFVSVNDGLKPIEDIEAGDYVWSENPATGEVGLKRVVRTFINEKSVIVKVTVNDEVIETTEDHRFWVEGKGWVYAEDLEEGDVLRLGTCEDSVISKVERIKLDKPIYVYNFEVQDWHTYFVTDD